MKRCSVTSESLQPIDYTYRSTNSQAEHNGVGKSNSGDFLTGIEWRSPALTDSTPTELYKEPSPSLFLPLFCLRTY